MQNTHTPPPEPTLKEWLYTLIGLRQRMKITGQSMHPTLKQNDLVLIKTYKNTPPQTNDIIVLWHPTKTNLKIIKRLHHTTPEGNYFVLSDNNQGQDSRHYGPINPKLLIGKVTSHSSAPQNT